MVELGDA
jgi:hypothetical protein